MPSVKSTTSDHVKELQKTLALAKTMRLQLQRSIADIKKLQKDEKIDPAMFRHEWKDLSNQFSKLSTNIVSITDCARKIEKDMMGSDVDLDAAIAELGYVKIYELSDEDLVEELKSRGSLMVERPQSKKKEKNNEKEN